MLAPEDKNPVSNQSKSDFAGKFDAISDELKAVEDFIANQMVAGIDSVDRRLEHVTLVSGKMVRPALVLLSGQSCGRAGDLHIKIASIIEMVHMATLLHDDVIDNAENRRNVPTANAKWGNESAVLLGDFVLSKSFALSAQLNDNNISSVLADTAIRICAGELQQNINRDNWYLSEEEYFQIIEAKTASLFSSSCKLGAIASNADQETVQTFSDFGLYLGMAFQIADDLIDITGSQETEGKSLGRDIAEKKTTLPLIHFIKTLEKNDADKFITNLSAGRIPGKYQHLLFTSGSLDYSRQIARGYCDRAIDCLDRINAGRPRKLLTDIVGLIMKRAAVD